MRAGRSQRGVAASTAHRKSIAGPSVINRNSRDGGYFTVFRNDSTVKTADLCVLQRQRIAIVIDRAQHTESDRQSKAEAQKEMFFGERKASYKFAPEYSQPP